MNENYCKHILYLLSSESSTTLKPIEGNKLLYKIDNIFKVYAETDICYMLVSLRIIQKHILDKSNKH